MQAFRGKGMNGVMTFLLTKVIKKNPDITYKGIMDQMGKEIEDIMRSNCRPSFLQQMFRPKIVQVGIFFSFYAYPFYFK